MRIGVVGINHKLAGLGLREQLAITCRRRFGPEGSAHIFHFFILLSTCNRTEVYFTSEDLACTHTYLLSILREEVKEEFDQKLYSYFGLDCFQHLSKVTAGLDSAILAETEIQGQVKSAYEKTAEGSGNLPEELHFLFQKALKIGKKIRTSLPMKRDTADLEHTILNTGADFFKQANPPKILFIGASEINKKVLAFFKSKKMGSIILCNRSPEPAQTLAGEYNIHTLPWMELARWHEFDWIILGTKSPDYLIVKQNIPDSLSDKKLVIDLSVPRNADPAIKQHSAITLLNIDQINQSIKSRKKSLSKMLSEAEQLIHESAKLQIELFQCKKEARKLFLALEA